MTRATPRPSWGLWPTRAGRPAPTPCWRGIARPFDGDESGTAACDIGAFELNVIPQPGADQQIYLPSLAR